MQSAHWIVKQYLHKRILLCVLVALGVFSLTLGIGFILQRSENKQQIESYTQRAVTTMDKIWKKNAFACNRLSENPVMTVCYSFVNRSQP